MASPKKSSPAKPPVVPDPEPVSSEEPEIDRAAQEFHSLAKKLSKHTLSPEVRAFYLSLHDRESCLARGRSIGSPPVIADALQMFQTATPVFAQKTLPGFGPTRMVFAIETAQKHVSVYEEYLSRNVQKLGVSTTKSSVRSSTRRALRNLGSILLSVVPRNTTLWNEIDTATTGPVKTTTELVSAFGVLSTLAKKVFETAKTNQAMQFVLDDMGISSETIAEMIRPGTELQAAVSAHTSSKTEVASGSDELNFLDGLVWDLMDELLDAMDRARETDPSLPALRFVHLHRTPVVRKKPVPAPTPT